MRTVKFNTTDGPKSVLFPDSMSEFTLEQIIEVERKGVVDPLEMFSILTGLPLAFIDNQAQSLEDKVFELIEPIFVAKVDPAKLIHPNKLLVDGKLYSLPVIKDQTLGQSILFSQAITNAPSIYDAVAEALAIYFQPVIDSTRFDRHRLPAIKALLLKAPGLDCLATFSFFLTKQRSLNDIGRSALNLLNKTRFNRSLVMVKRYTAPSIGLIP